MTYEFKDHFRPGYVYVVESESGHCRVGVSYDRGNYHPDFSHSLQSRVRQNLYYSPYPTKLVMTVWAKRALDLEQGILWTFRDRSANGDWVAVPGEEIINSLSQVMKEVALKHELENELTAWIRNGGFRSKFLKKEEKVRLSNLRDHGTITFGSFFVALPAFLAERDQSIKAA